MSSDPATSRLAWHRRPDVRLSALQAANFAGIGIYMPFMPAWLSAQGLSDRQIGLTLALGMIIRMLTSQPVTALGDGKRGAVRILVLLHLLGAAGYLALTTLPTPAAIIAAMAVIAVINSGIIPLGDHLTMAEVRLRPSLDFARMRLWGSIAFLFMSTLSGFAVARLGIGMVPVALAACCVVAAFVALAAPEHRGDSVPQAEELDPDDVSARARLLWLAIIASALINASHATLYSFATLHWRSIGIDDGTIGVLWSVAVVAEIAIFWAMGRRASSSLIAALGFLALSGLAAALRFLALPFAGSVPLIFGLQLLHAFSFGAQLLGIMAIVSMLAPEGRRARIQGRLSAANACLMGLATLASGFSYEWLEGMAFAAMAPVALAGLAVLAVAWRLARTVAVPPATTSDAGLGPVSLDSTGHGALPVRSMGANHERCARRVFTEARSQPRPHRAIGQD
jgi:MFS transporter, PPP family, 3-phenylpropionic acid transporter